MFRIDRVYLISDHWQIDLTAVDDEDSQVHDLLRPWKKILDESIFFSKRYKQLFIRDLTLENDSFLSFQLLIDMMLRLEQTEFARAEMIETCRQNYVDSSTDLKRIEEFEHTYRHEDALRWYTADCFLYRLLNESLRKEDIDSIFKLRYFIYDLHNQLAQLQISYIQSLPSDQPILTLYRGQRIKTTQLDQLAANVNNLISMNSFLSTTSDRTAALFFSGHETLNSIHSRSKFQRTKNILKFLWKKVKHHSRSGRMNISNGCLPFEKMPSTFCFPATEVAVLYQIFVDTASFHSIPFAKVAYQSIFQDEDEVLFSMAPVFRVDAVKQDGTLWIVDLTLTNKEDKQWNLLTAHLNR
ncbi:unnamed protein product [Rotaria sp. Silwood1]|nr:unnamed protein product [Rotaria sp. Silwood1]CAF4784630.1 unnamed protein product [Rotaria sp. Silwood1]